jgi:hypothetical protein
VHEHQAWKTMRPELSTGMYVAPFLPCIPHIALSPSLSVFLSVFFWVGKSLGFVIMSGSSDSVAWELGFWVINNWWICDYLGFWSLIYLLDGLKDLELLLCFCVLWRRRSIDLFRSRSLVDSRQHRFVSHCAHHQKDCAAYQAQFHLKKTVAAYRKP